MSYCARLTCVALGLMVLSGPAAAATITDDFNDNSMSTAYALIEDDPNALWLEETNQRLELRSAGGGVSSNDAIYLTNGPVGYQLLTANDFQITIDFSFTAFTGTGTIAADLGIGRDLDGKDSAAVAFLRSSNGVIDMGLVAAWRVNDVQQEGPIGYANPSGTFKIAYDSSLDRLTLGLNDGVTTTNLDNLVKGQWSADKVWVSFGGRGEGLTLASGNAYLDNLAVDGEYIVIPEPAALSLLAVGGLALVRCKMAPVG